MAQSEEAFEFRRVTLDDEDEVSGKLSDGIYAGHDYLPCVFRNWLCDGRHTMLCLVDRSTGRIVALDTVGLFDQGRTIVFQALRVHSDYRGKGVGKIIGRQMHDYVKEHCPQATRLRICTTVGNQASIKLHLREGYKNVLFNGFLMAKLTPAAKKLPTISKLPDGFLTMTASQLWDALTEDSLRRLVPAGVFLDDWMPYDFTKENLSFLESQGGKFLATRQGGKVTSFAIVGYSPRRSGVHVSISTFCGGDPSLFEPLFVTAAEVFCGKPGNEPEVKCGTCPSRHTYFLVHFDVRLQRLPQEVSTSLWTRVQESLPWAAFDADYVRQDTVMMEKDISHDADQPPWASPKL